MILDSPSIVRMLRRLRRIERRRAVLSDIVDRAAVVVAVLFVAVVLSFVGTALAGAASDVLIWKGVGQ